MKHQWKHGPQTKLIFVRCAPYVYPSKTFRTLSPSAGLRSSFVPSHHRGSLGLCSPFGAFSLVETYVFLRHAVTAADAQSTRPCRRHCRRTSALITLNLDNNGSVGTAWSDDGDDESVLSQR